MPLNLGGTRYIVVYFSESVVVSHLDIMKLVLRKLERGEFKSYPEDPGPDYYCYQFEIEIPPTDNEDEACQKEAIDMMSTCLERAEEYARRREDELALEEALESRYLVLVKDEIYLNKFPSYSDLSLMTMTDKGDDDQETEKGHESEDENQVDKEVVVSDANNEMTLVGSESEAGDIQA